MPGCLVCPLEARHKLTALGSRMCIVYYNRFRVSGIIVRSTGVGFKASESIVFSRIINFELGFGSWEWGSRERIQGWRLATEG